MNYRPWCSLVQWHQHSDIFNIKINCCSALNELMYFRCSIESETNSEDLSGYRGKTCPSSRTGVRGNPPPLLRVWFTFILRCIFISVVHALPISHRRIFNSYFSESFPRHADKTSVGFRYLHIPIEIVSFSLLLSFFFSSSVNLLRKIGFFLAKNFHRRVAYDTWNKMAVQLVRWWFYSGENKSGEEE